MNDCDVLRRDLQKELAAAYQLMDDKEYAAAALCFLTARRLRIPAGRPGWPAWERTTKGGRHE